MFKLGLAFLFIFTLSALAQNSFKIPEPTIINDPDFYVKNTQGDSDGKTIGMDGQKLEDHRIYMFDTGYFLERMEMGLQTDDNARKSLYRDIKNIARQKEDQRGSSVDAFKAKYKIDPLTMGQFKYFELMCEIQEAKKVYDAALANLNYKEKLRVKDRIDLENAPTDEGKQIRESMKESITEVHKLRTEVESKFAAVLKRGAAIQKKEHTKPSFPVLVVKEDKTLFFAYQKMSGSALTGLGEFLDGKPVSKAKPLELSEGSKVFYQKSDEVELNGKKLKVFYVLNEGEVRDPRTGKSFTMKLYGWVYPGHFKKE